MGLSVAEAQKPSAARQFRELSELVLWFLSSGERKLLFLWRNVAV